ncbi:hypothetical protein LCGC14_1293180 [marine sediment metagenome]|uniref:Uncharacterized protein n=1 Tax=marine sediment metagenome TaxID=412755 RepID=A0A0F9N8A5_9ZZZZ
MFEQTKEQVEIIFAKAKVEVWTERLRDGECTYQEFMDAFEQGEEQ